MRWVIMPAEVTKAAPSQPRWLTIVGIGEDGVAGLGDEAKQRDCARPKSSSAASGIWRWSRPSPRARPALAEPVRCRDARTCWRSRAERSACSPPATRSSTASAPPSPARSRPRKCWSFPRPSSFSLAAARLGWALQDVETISLHGHSIDLIRPLLHPGTPHPCADLGRRRPGGDRAAADRARLRRLAADRPGSAGRAWTSACDQRAQRLRPRKTSIRSTCWRSKLNSTPRCPNPAADIGPWRRSVRA